MQGLWDGIENAPTFERGAWFKPGFVGLVRIVRCKVQQTQKKKTIQFLAECEVLSSNTPDHPVGSQGTWFQNQNNSFLPAIKSFVHAVLGVDERRTDDAARLGMVDRALTPIMNFVAGVPNGFGGYVVALSTHQTVKTDGGPFTRHDWAAYNYVASGQVPPDVDRFVAAAMPYANVHAQAQMAPAQAQPQNQGWGQPQGFGAPPGFAQPQGYGAPQAPAPSPYGAPPPNPYGQPPQGYGAPPQAPPGNGHGYGGPAFAAPPAFQTPTFHQAPPLPAPVPQGYGAPPQAPAMAPPPLPAPAPQVSPDGFYKLVNGQWVPNR